MQSLKVLYTKSPASWFENISFFIIRNMSDYNVITSDFVNLSITNSSQNSYCVERRFQKGITIDEFKVRI